MEDRLEDLVAEVFKKWQSEHQAKEGEYHPDEETFASFLDGLLSPEESRHFELHLISCPGCTEVISAQAKLLADEGITLPEGLLSGIKKWVREQLRQTLLEIILKIKEKTIEVINTTGDILVGQELVPAPLLRSRSIKDFPEQVSILKDFKDIRVEIKVENKQGKAFNLAVAVKDKARQEARKDLRITLIRDDLELESYDTDSGKACFEQVALGRYMVEISSLNDKLALVTLEINK